MFKFDRTKILPLFLEKRITVAELARLAGVAHPSAQKAVSGERVSATIISKIADALGIENVTDFLVEPTHDYKTFEPADFSGNFSY